MLGPSFDEFVALEGEPTPVLSFTPDPDATMHQRYPSIKLPRMRLSTMRGDMWGVQAGPPGSYPDRTSTGRRRRAYEREETPWPTSRCHLQFCQEHGDAPLAGSSEWSHGAPAQNVGSPEYGDFSG